MMLLVYQNILSSPQATSVLRSSPSTLWMRTASWWTSQTPSPASIASRSSSASGTFSRRTSSTGLATINLEVQARWSIQPLPRLFSSSVLPTQSFSIPNSIPLPRSSSSIKSAFFFKFRFSYNLLFYSTNVHFKEYKWMYRRWLVSQLWDWTLWGLFGNTNFCFILQPIS